MEFIKPNTIRLIWLFPWLNFLLLSTEEMKETSFISQNKDKWSEGEKLFKKETSNPEEISEMFVEVSEDLSYSRTFYPHRGVRIYLNRFAQALFFKIDIRKVTLKGIKKFWKEEIPYSMHQSRKDMRLALFIFFIGALIGTTSNLYDPEFVRGILGDHYVNMTLENIDKGDPVAVYKSHGATDMFFYITLNNLMVAYRTFVMGIMFSVGSVLILFYNAVMVGSFQTFFFQHGVGFESMLAIWLHGTLEISSIILAGGAGLTLGRGLLFPDTYTRFEAFQMSAQRGIKVMIGITPVFILAGFIESFATRFTDAPTIIRLIIILSSLFFILGYYVWLPWQKNKKGFSKDLGLYRIPPTDTEKIELLKIKEMSEMLSSSIKLIKEMGSFPLKMSLGAALAFSFYFIYDHSDGNLLDIINGSGIITNIYRYFTYYQLNLGFLINTVLFFLVFGSVILAAKRYLKPEKKFSTRQWGVLLVLVVLWNFIFLLPESVSWWVSMLLTPFVFLMMVGAFYWEEQKLNVNQIISVGWIQYYKSIALLVVMSILAFVMMMILYSPFIWTYFEVIQMNIDMEAETAVQLIAFIITFVLSFVYFFIYQMILVGMVMAFYSNLEVKFAWELKSRISKIKTKKFAYGLEREVD